MPDPFFSVEASGAAVPKEEINTDELVERFKEFCSTEGGRESLGENLKGWLKGDLRYDAVEGMLVPRGEGEREGEGEEERRAQNADVTDGCLIC